MAIFTSYSCGVATRTCLTIGVYRVRCAYLSGSAGGLGRSSASVGRFDVVSSARPRESPRKTVPWSVIGMFLPDRPVEATLLDHFGPLLVTRSGKKYALLVTDRFHHRVAMYATTVARLTAIGAVDIIANDFISKWSCPKSRLSETGKQFPSELWRVVCEVIGMRKLTTSAYDPVGNGGTERVNH